MERKTRDCEANETNNEKNNGKLTEKNNGPTQNRGSAFCKRRRLSQGMINLKIERLKNENALLKQETEWL